MSAWLVRFLVLIISCAVIARAYPSPVSNFKLLQGRLSHHPHGVFEVSSDNIDNDFYDNDDLPVWLSRSRKFCCAPPL